MLREVLWCIMTCHLTSIHHEHVLTYHANRNKSFDSMVLGHECSQSVACYVSGFLLLVYSRMFHQFGLFGNHHWLVGCVLPSTWPQPLPSPPTQPEKRWGMGEVGDR